MDHQCGLDVVLFLTIHFDRRFGGFQSWLYDPRFSSRDGFYMMRTFCTKWYPHLKKLQFDLVPQIFFSLGGNDLNLLDAFGYLVVIYPGLQFLGSIFTLLILIIFITPFKTSEPLTIQHLIAAILKTVTSWIPSPTTAFIVLKNEAFLQIVLGDKYFISLCTGQLPSKHFITVLDHSTNFDLFPSFWIFTWCPSIFDEGNFKGTVESVPYDAPSDVGYIYQVKTNTIQVRLIQ